jgi:hypothetical protein
MAAFFIRKSDNLHYLRLTGNTTTVKFAAAKEALNSYRLDILRPVGVGGTISIAATTTTNVHTSSAVPIPNGSTLNQNVFTNVETSFVFESGPTTRDYQVRGFSTNNDIIEYTYNQSAAINKSVGCKHYFNNEENLDVGLATTVAGKFDTASFTSNDIQTSAGENNTGNLAIQLSDNNGIAGIEPLNRARDDHPSCDGSVSQMYGIGNTTFVSHNAGPAKAYRCWFATPFPNTNYNVSITGLSSSPYGAAGPDELPGRVRYVCTVDKQPGYVAYTIDSYRIEEGVVTPTGIGFIRYHEVKSESVVESKRLTLGGEIVSVNSGFSTSYPGFKKFTGLFVKQSGTWKSPPTTHIKHSGEWKIPTEISIKHNGAWERVSPPDAYSNWINMLENFDDALDFAVQVHAIN